MYTFNLPVSLARRSLAYLGTPYLKGTKELYVHSLTCNYYYYSLYRGRKSLSKDISAKRKVDRELLNMCCFARVVNVMSNSSTYGNAH